MTSRPDSTDPTDPTGPSGPSESSDPGAPTAPAANAANATPPANTAQAGSASAGSAPTASAGHGDAALQDILDGHVRVPLDTWVPPGYARSSNSRFVIQTLLSLLLFFILHFYF
ncbi:hypothetical protein N7540_008853 [Penicillium herquei]|nr:hypothetical protein N7540_008853 [Penicillium herquei]